MLDSLPPPPPACIAALTTLRYPPLAAMAGVEGIVTLRLTRGAEGREVVLTGHPLLKPAVEHAAAETSFPEECPPELEFEFEFVIQGEPSYKRESKVTVASPTVMRIERPPTLLVCGMETPFVRRPWYKRLFARR